MHISCFIPWFPGQLSLNLRLQKDSCMPIKPHQAIGMLPLVRKTSLLKCCQKCWQNPDFWREKFIAGEKTLQKVRKTQFYMQKPEPPIVKNLSHNEKPFSLVEKSLCV